MAEGGISVLGPAGYPKSPYGSFAGKVMTNIGPFGPMVGAIGATVLTNKPSGPPGKHFTKKQKTDLLFDIYEEGLLAKEALKRFDGLSELETAELQLEEAEVVHQEAADKLKTSYSRRLYEDAEDAEAKLNELRDKVDVLRAQEAKRRAKEDAKAKIRKQMNDAIAKIRKH